MKKDLRLTVLPSPGPSVTPEDHEFALMVQKEYKVHDLPFDELCWLILNVRYTLKDRFLVLEEYSNEEFQKYSDKLFANDAEIKEINITTNKGIVNFNPSDDLFSYFKSPIDKIKWNIKREKNIDIEHIKRMSMEIAFQEIAFYFFHTNLTPDQKYSAIGMFMAYLKIYKGEPIKTKEEHNRSDSVSWKNYLSGRVRPLLKKYGPKYFNSL